MKSQQKAILVIAHLSIFLARTGFGLIVPLLIYLSSGGVFNQDFKNRAFEILLFQAKITFAYLFFQFLAIVFQLANGIAGESWFSGLEFSSLHPLAILNLAAQIVLAFGVVAGLFAVSAEIMERKFTYPSLGLRFFDR